MGPLPADLAVRDWATILDRLTEARLLSVTLTGGEPLVREDFPLLLREVLARPLRLSLNTNATLVTAEAAALLAGGAPRLDVVMVSLDGDTPEVHDRIRGDGAFRRAMEGVERLAGAGVPLCFYCTVNRENAGRLRPIAELALRYGGWIRFNSFLDAGPGTDSGLSPDASQVGTASREVLELAERHGRRIRGAFLDMARLGAEAAAGRGIPFGPAKGPACGGGKHRIAVMPDGWVTPCDHLPAVRLGSLLETSLERILRGPGTVAFRETAARRIHTLDRCRECDVRQLCPGSCPGAPCSEIHCIANYMGGRG